MAKPGTTGVEKHLRSVFPDGAISRVQVLEYGDDPAVEPGDVAVRVFLPRPDRPEGEEADEEIVGSFEKANRERLRKLNDDLPGAVAWVEFQADSPGGAERRRRHVLKIARVGRARKPLDDAAEQLTPVMTRLGPADLATVDTLITTGIAASRAEGVRWALARIREQPAYAQLSERAHEPGGPQPSAGLDRAKRDQLQSRLDEQMKEHFPDAGVQRIALLQHGDDPSVEPGDLLVRVFIEEADEAPNLPARNRDHETIIRELQPELAEQLPGASHLEFWFGENGRQGRTGSPQGDPARSEQDLTPAQIRLGPEDLEMLDALITAGTVASRAEALGWVLARIRERPAYARLSERARELDELKAHF